jgi:hypothetical protein
MPLARQMTEGRRQLHPTPQDHLDRSTPFPEAMTTKRVDGFQQF